jgi:hypothetical protein
VNEFKEYLVDGIRIKARPTPGFGFYEVVMPNGEKLMVVKWAFEAQAIELKETYPGQAYFHRVSPNIKRAEETWEKNHGACKK